MRRPASPARTTSPGRHCRKAHPWNCTHSARRGRSFAFEEVHLWAVPIHSPDPRLAFRVAHFLGQRGLQQREAEAEGMLPVREDLRRDYPVAFRLEWMQRMLDASFRQLERGSGDLPAAWDDWDDKYLKVRQSVVYGRPKNAKVTLAAIREAVQHATRELPVEAAHDAR